MHMGFGSRAFCWINSLCASGGFGWDSMWMGTASMWDQTRNAWGHQLGLGMPKNDRERAYHRPYH